MKPALNLNNLLQQAESLVSDVKEGDTGYNQSFSKVRSLGELKSTAVTSIPGIGADKYYAHPGHSSVQNEIKAARLLGNKASWLELPAHLSEKLESLNVLESLKPVAAPSDAIGTTGIDAASIDATDISTFLKNERENALLAVIESTRKATLAACDNSRQSAMDRWWSTQKQMVIHQLAGDATSGLEQSPDVLNLVRDPHGNDLRNMSRIVGIPATSNLNQMELTYAKQVDTYLHQERLTENASLIEEKPSLYPSLRDISYGNISNLNRGSSASSTISDFLSAPFIKRGWNADGLETVASPLCKREKSFITTDLSLAIDNFQEVSELWRLIHRLCSCQDSSGLQRKTPSAILVRRDSFELQSELVQAALSHLESEYLTYIRSIVQSAPREARLGGVPGTRSLAKAFLGLQVLPGLTAHNNTSRKDHLMVSNLPPELEDGVVDGRPVWPMLYVCLRCGDFKAAMSIASEFRAALGDFVDLLCEYVNNNRHLSSDSKVKIRLLYRRSIKPTSDPYKRLLYCLVGACDPFDNHSDVTNSIDDFLWLKLSQITWIERDNPSEYSSHISMQHTRGGDTGHGMDDFLLLPQLQKLLLEEYGESHFDAANQPLLFFKVLLLTQQFESAIGFLSRFEALRAHSLHVALALYETGLLLVTHNSQVQMVSHSDTDQYRRLNITRLILMYTRKFESHELRDAMNYFFFLKTIPVNSEKEDILESSTVNSFVQVNDLTMFHQCVTELVMQSREFTLFFGQLDNKGNRKRGLLDDFANEINIDQLIYYVGLTLQKRGYLEDAWLCYELSSKWDDAVLLANQLLTQQLLQRPSATVTSTVIQSNDHLRTERIIAHAERLAMYLRQSAEISIGGQTSGPSVLHSTLYHLLDVCQFFSLHASCEWQRCLHVMDNLRLLPSEYSSRSGSAATTSDRNAGIDQVEARVRDFSTRLPEEITRLIPQLLLATMQAVCELWKMAKQSNLNRSMTVNLSPIKKESSIYRSTYTVEELKSRATALLTFASRINYRMPGDVYNKMFQMEREMI